MLMYFTNEKKRKAMQDLHTIHECAEKAGIRKALFVNFGMLLGMVREGDFIAHDNDIDMCIKSNLISKEQEDKYLQLLIENEMFFARKRITRRTDTNRLTWFSLRHRHDRAKFCHWMMFPWNGYYWHTKAGMWVNLRKFPKKDWKYNSDDVAIMKGIPRECLDELIEVDFRGLKVQIPHNFGMSLDYMYPGWRVPRKGGASAKTTIAVVPRWDKESTWKVQHAF